MTQHKADLKTVLDALEGSEVLDCHSPDPRHHEKVREIRAAMDRLREGCK